jgi:hypothetical protein
LDAAENETLLFKTQLREGNVLTWNAGHRKAGHLRVRRGGALDGCYSGFATLPREACLKRVEPVSGPALPHRFSLQPRAFSSG